ncbi:MAG TPA: alcohol dehydrogenase catalytic domain-containing protein [Euzebyales bacterium]|nr:alcohol dehydrogenase catalytic domain-containing protein [Euzebyales bacterium]
MRAAVFHGRRDVRVETVDDPVPQAGELLLRISVAGICGTDAHEFAHGPTMLPIDEPHPVTGHVGPIILGHELAGTVVAVGDGAAGFAVDDLVVSGAGVWCGRCVQCGRGRTNLCLRYTTVGLQRDGGLAQYCRVPAITCRAVRPYGLPDDAAVLAQPMAIATHAVRRGRVTPDDRAVIIGAGGIGAFLTFAAVQHGAQVTVMDLDRDRLDLADRLGAHRVVVPQPGEPAREAVGVAVGDPTVVFEVTGRTAGLATARELLPAGGRLVIVGLQPAAVELDLLDLTLREVEVIGTNAHVCADDLPHALGLLAAREGSWSDVAPVALALDEVVTEGLEPLAAGRGRRVKTLIDPWTAHTRSTVM